MPKKIIFKGKDGSVAIMILSSDDIQLEDPVNQFKAAHDGFYKEHFVVGEDYKIPEDRLFRDAWTLDKNNNISIDKKKAVEIHLNRIRKSRNSKLDKLDRLQLRYLNDKEKLDEIEKEKQLLRDLTKDIKLDVNNPMAAWPSCLPEYLMN